MRVQPNVRMKRSVIDRYHYEVEKEVGEGICRIGNIRVVIFARESIAGIFLVIRIMENARPLTKETIPAEDFMRGKVNGLKEAIWYTCQILANSHVESFLVHQTPFLLSLTASKRVASHIEVLSGPTDLTLFSFWTSPNERGTSLFCEEEESKTNSSHSEEESMGTLKQKPLTLDESLEKAISSKT
ncbi:hypothetical protein TNCV_1309231 [Trichonephila clavipes]|nr:hypothetical protein TNCV_1309231 [Trichonephila clavipes]